MASRRILQTLATQSAQPQYPAPIDRSNSITQGLGLLVSPSFGDALSGNRLVINGGFSVGAGVSGIAAIGPATQIPGYVACDQVTPMPVNGDYTVMLYASATGSTSGLNTHIFEVSGTLTTTSFQIGGASVAAFIDGNAATAVAGDFTKPTAFIATRVGNQITLYANKISGASSVTGTRTGTITGITFGVNRLGNNNPNPTVGYLAAAWNRALSFAEISALSDNPWQLFQAPRRNLFTNAPANTSLRRIQQKLLKKFAKQPQYATQVDSKSAPNFAVGVVGNNLYDFVNNVQALIAGTTTFTPTVDRIDAVFNGTATSYALLYGPASAYDILGPLTLMWVGSISDVAANNILISRAYNNGATNNPFELRLNPGGVIQLLRSNAVGYAYVTASNTAPVNTPLVIIAQADSAGTQFIINGLYSNAGVTLPYPSAAGSNQPLSLGRRDDGNYSTNHTALAVGWPRILSRKEVDDLTANPWQVFQPSSRNLFTNSPLYSSRIVLAEKPVRTTQPQYATSIDWSNSITKGLLIAVLPFVDMNLVDGTVLSQPAPKSIGVRTGGVAVTVGASMLPNPVSSSSYEARFDLNVMTALVVASQDVETNAGDSFFRGNGSSNPSWRIGLWGGSSSGVYATMGSFNYTPSTRTFDPKQNNIAAITGDGTNAVVYANGLAVATSIYTPAATQYDPANFRGVIFGSVSGIISETNTRPKLGLMWNRALSASEIASVSANPWQVFK